MSDLVVKSNSLINAKGKYKYSKNELKLICNLISTIHKEDIDFQKKTIRLIDLGFTDKEMKNHLYLNELCENLLSKPFKIPDTHYYVNWFSLIGAKDGVITYRFDPDLKPYLLTLKEQFTSYYLENVLKLTSSYSIQIYELLKQLETVNFRKIAIEEFKEILSIPKSYKFSNIKNLLEKVKQDLEEKTDIKFTYTLEKQSRKFTHINFKIVKNSENDRNIQSFIKQVRKNYINQPIMKINAYKKLVTISVNREGKLYCLDNREMTFDSKESQKIWNHFFENQDKLQPFTSSLF